MHCPISLLFAVAFTRCWACHNGLCVFVFVRRCCCCFYLPAVWSSDPPVLLYPSLLPSSLTELQCLDVWCLDELPVDRSSTGFNPGCHMIGGSGSSGAMHRSGSYCSITGILMGMSSVGRDLYQLGNGAFSGSDGTEGAAGAGVVPDTSSTTSSCSSLGQAMWQQQQHHQPQQHQQHQPQAQQQAIGSLSSSSSSSALLVLHTPHLKRLVLRSTCPFDRRLLMPDLSLCSLLEQLELHHSQLNQCHVQHIAAICAHSLRSLKLVAVDDGARIRFSGLTVLTRLTALTSLSVHAHERAINKNVRGAIASMGQLRNLTLLTSPDYPSAFARNLGCLTQLTNLMVLRVGLGFGALDALRRLGAQVTKSLPHCTYQMLTDGCSD